MLTIDVIKIFVDVLEKTPGIKQILDENNSEKLAYPLSAELIDNRWNFTVSIVILKNTNCKDLLLSINKSLDYVLKQKQQKMGKLNIFIEGIANE
ncbi:hypothetical protein [Mycoplasmopsis gallinarum]|uniref:Uncharacterized protein n=1 Tax=Mycoplasmopsis gallinarum TaxID=29557 RepID=A0A162MH67_9BACT|nr:hypothetical protein [Mycoplasmopsis gallinarum]OAB48675.1 hypothetical protein MGALLINA_06000 [Mycoplasmopsis gallinarum]